MRIRFGIFSLLMLNNTIYSNSFIEENKEIDTLPITMLVIGSVFLGQRIDAADNDFEIFFLLSRTLEGCFIV